MSRNSHIVSHMLTKHLVLLFIQEGKTADDMDIESGMNNVLMF